jgi:hypothetical protein
VINNFKYSPDTFDQFGALADQQVSPTQRQRYDSAVQCPPDGPSNAMSGKTSNALSTMALTIVMSGWKEKANASHDNELCL